MDRKREGSDWDSKRKGSDSGSTLITLRKECLSKCSKWFTTYRKPVKITMTKKNTNWNLLTRNNSEVHKSHRQNLHGCAGWRSVRLINRALPCNALVFRSLYDLQYPFVIINSKVIYFNQTSVCINRCGMNFASVHWVLFIQRGLYVDMSSMNLVTVNKIETNGLFRPHSFLYFCLLELKVPLRHCVFLLI